MGAFIALAPIILQFLNLIASSAIPALATYEATGSKTGATITGVAAATNHLRGNPLSKKARKNKKEELTQP